MANFSNSVLAAAIAKATSQFQAIENRDQEYGAIKMFRQNSDMFPVIPRLGTLKQRPSSFRLNLDAPRSGDNALTCDPVGTRGDSVDTSLVWKTYTNELTIPYKSETENLYTVEEQAAIDVRNMWKGTINEIETDAVTYLNTNRSQNDISGVNSTWNGATDYYNSIAVAKADRVRSIIRDEMRKAKYTGQLQLLHSMNYDELFQNTQIQGSGNSRNYADQDRLFNYFYTNEDIDIASTYGGLFVVPLGGIAMLMWIDPLYRKNKMAGDKEWFTINDPIFGMEFGAYRKMDCADSTAVGGAAQDLVESLQINVDIAFTHAPVSSPANETPVHKYALATS